MGHDTHTRLVTFSKSCPIIATAAYSNTWQASDKTAAATDDRLHDSRKRKGLYQYTFQYHVFEFALLADFLVSPAFYYIVQHRA